MSLKAKERERLAARENAMTEEDPTLFRPEPPGPAPCPRCDEWKIENRDVGRYAWWMICDYTTCDCVCHDNQVILAAPYCATTHHAVACQAVVGSPPA